MAKIIGSSICCLGKVLISFKHFATCPLSLLCSGFLCSGVMLIEREEEVCVFYEKINIQEMMSRKGDMEINVMDEKIRFLKLKLTEKKRQIELALKILPLKRGLDADLVVLQIQVTIF